MDTLIQGGVIVTPEGSFKGDIRIRGEVIVEIGEELLSEGAKVVPAEGKLLFPGFIDTHTHFDLDAGTFHTADDFVTGTKAAVSGGTTVILDFTTQEKGETLMEALNNWHRLADGKCSCDYGFHMSITDWNEAVRKELPLMTREGVTSYKLYMAYDNLKVSDGEIFEILKAVEAEGGIIGVHCENGELIKELSGELLARGETGPSAHPKARPAEIEAEAINRLLTIAKMAGTPVNIVHLSTRRGFQVVKAARSEGQQVYVESCPQYFLLEDSKYNLPGFESAKYVLSPPLRKKEDVDCLWEALSAGEIDTLGTDHCSFHFKGQKERGLHDFTRIPNGLPGVEHRPVLMYTYGVGTGRITKEQFCSALSENPARLFGMYPKKGALKVGSDADIVIWDPEAESVISAKTQVQNVDHTPFEGIKIKGRPIQVYLRGKLVAQEGRVTDPGLGSYLHRGKSDLKR